MGRLTELDMDSLTEESARYIGLGYLSDRLSEAGGSVGCGCAVMLIFGLLFQDPSVGTLAGDMSIPETIRLHKLVRQFRKGTYSGSYIDAVKELRVDESCREINRFIADLKKRVGQAVDGLGPAVDFDPAWHYIEIYKSFKEDHPGFDQKSINRAIELIEDQYDRQKNALGE